MHRDGILKQSSGIVRNNDGSLRANDGILKQSSGIVRNNDGNLRANDEMSGQ